MPIVVMYDPHFTDVPPAPRSEEYLYCLTAKMLEVRLLCKRLGAIPVIAGDLFHRKSPERVTHYTVAIASRILQDMGAYAILGNHDMTGSNVGSHQRHPIGTLFASRVLHKLGAETWQLGADRVEVLGIDYDEEFEKGEKEIELPDLPAGVKTRLVIMHSEMRPKHKENLKGNFKWCFYGHMHKDDGVQGRFVSHGAMMRTRGVDWDTTRIPAVTLVHDDLTIERIQLKSVKPWDEVKAKVRLKPKDEDETDLFEDFIAALQRGMASEEQDLESLLKELDPEIRRRVEGYIA